MTLPVDVADIPTYDSFQLYINSLVSTDYALDCHTLSEAYFRQLYIITFKQIRNNSTLRNCILDCCITPNDPLECYNKFIYLYIAAKYYADNNIEQPYTFRKSGSVSKAIDSTLYPYSAQQLIDNPYTKLLFSMYPCFSKMQKGKYIKMGIVGC